VPTIALWAGWRWAFVAGAVVAMIGFLLAPAVTSPSPAGKVGVRQPAAIDYGPLIRLGLAVALGSAAATSVASFFVPAATRLSISEGRAGLLLAFSSAVVIAARILAGLAADRSRRDPLATVMVMMGVSTLGYVVAASSSQWLMPLGALFAMGAGWSWSGLVVHAVVRHYRDTPGAATGITSGAQNVGGVVGPVLFGLLAEHVSYASAFLAVAACAALASFAASAGRRRLRGAAAPVSA
jgi:predicted MFS family arabinose efflux permease